MTKQLLIETIVSSLLVLQLVGFAFFVLIDKYIDKKRKKFLFWIIVCIFSLIVQNILEYILIEYFSIQYFRITVAVFGYIVRTVVIVLFMYIIDPKKNYFISWILVGINALFHLTAYFTDICFTISDTNHYTGGPLSSLCFIVSLVLLAYLLFTVVREYIKNNKKEILIPIFLTLLIVIAMILDLIFNEKSQMLDYVTFTLCFVSMFFYIWLHVQFFRFYEKNLIENQRVKLMLSQIEPHFIYNSLNAIQAFEIFR